MHGGAGVGFGQMEAGRQARGGGAARHCLALLLLLLLLLPGRGCTRQDSQVGSPPR